MKRVSIALAIILVLFLVACAGQDVKPVSEMTPKEKATWMLSMYNKQYDDYLVVAAKPDLTEAQKEVLRKKKKIMQEVYPLIELYSSYVEAGSVPTKETEAQIINYLNELATLVTE